MVVEGLASQMAGEGFKSMASAQISYLIVLWIQWNWPCGEGFYAVQDIFNIPPPTQSE